MEKTIVIDGKQVRLKSTAATVKRYKAQFRRDLFADMMALGAIGTFTPQDGSQPSIDLSNVDLKKIDLVNYGADRDDYFTDIMLDQGEYVVVGYSFYDEGSYMSKFIRYSKALKVLGVE